MIKVVAVGDNCMDVYPSLHKAYPGGNAVNYSVYARQIGMESAYVGVVGDDEYGRTMIEALRGHGVDVTHVRQLRGRTAVTYIELHGNDRELGDYDEGVFEKFTLTEDDLEFICKNHQAVHAGFWGKTNPYLAEFKKRGLVVSFDFSDKLDAPEVAAALPNVDYAFFSYNQVDDDIMMYLKAAKEKGPKVVVATLGSQGSIAYDGEKFYRHGIMSVEVVDTLGAGDAFITGFMNGILRNESLPKSLELGTNLAAHVVTYFGAWKFAP